MGGKLSCNARLVFLALNESPKTRDSNCKLRHEKCCFLRMLRKIVVRCVLFTVRKIVKNCQYKNIRQHKTCLVGQVMMEIFCAVYFQCLTNIQKLGLSMKNMLFVMHIVTENPRMTFLV